MSLRPRDCMTALNAGFLFLHHLHVFLVLAVANAALAQTNLLPITKTNTLRAAVLVGKPLTAEYWLQEAQRTNAPQAVRDEALRARDTEVAAAEDKLPHISIIGTNIPAAEAALRKLETVGDEFTVHWLEILAQRLGPDLFRPQLLATHARIEKRLAEASPRPPGRLVRERLLRAAVANMTCNPLESGSPASSCDWPDRMFLNRFSARSSANSLRKSRHPKVPPGSKPFGDWPRGGRPACF